ncbi:5-hydroxytryptamine receptor-like protein [Corchorus capsularis]|uniref:5-hydroxytryptamine receptor-like protein n=1 Tax=Corchorus capsularis TaxID=210143 RepID=A0A1R3KBL5_COCAP|nr:5-hydroxytryptamine receptor-like protein [Corchorus capsularis]
MVDLTSSTDVDSTEPAASAQAPSQPVDATMKPEYGPWMIVQRKPCRTTKEAVNEDSGELTKDQVVEEFRAKIVDPIIQRNLKMQNDKNGNGRSVWKPKQDAGIKFKSKKGKEGFKAKNKESVPTYKRAELPQPYSAFESNKVNGPSGFSFKAGSLKNFSFDLKRLEDLVGSSHFGLSHLMGKQDNSILGKDLTNGEFSKAETSSGDANMVLPSDAISLPPQ